MKDSIRFAGVSRIPFVKPGANTTYPLMGAEAERLGRIDFDDLNLAQDADSGTLPVLIRGKSRGVICHRVA